MEYLGQARGIDVGAGVWGVGPAHKGGAAPEYSIHRLLQDQGEPTTEQEPRQRRRRRGPILRRRHFDRCEIGSCGCGSGRRLCRVPCKGDPPPDSGAAYEGKEPIAKGESFSF